VPIVLVLVVVIVSSRSTEHEHDDEDECGSGHFEPPLTSIAVSRAFHSAERRQTKAGRPRLLNPALALYISTMIAVKAENGCLQVTIATEGMTPGEINDFVSWLRVESVVRRSRLTPEAAWKLSEDIKSDWWQANERRLTPEGAE